MRLQLGQGPGGEVGAGANPEPLHLGGGDRPDSVESGDWQGRNEGRPLLGRDDAEAVGLVLVGSELGDELAIGNPGRGGQLALLADSATDVLGNGAGGAEPASVLGDVE